MVLLELATVFIYLCNNSTFTFNLFFNFLIIYLFMYLFLYYFPSAFPLSYCHNIILDSFNGIFIYLFIKKCISFFFISVSFSPKTPKNPSVLTSMRYKSQSEKNENHKIQLSKCIPSNKHSLIWNIIHNRFYESQSVEMWMWRQEGFERLRLTQAARSCDQDIHCLSS